MRRTAESIEEAKEARSSEKPQSKHPKGKVTGFRGPSPDVGKATQFKPGQSGNPGGRPKNDLAREIAQGVFENNPELIHRAFCRALRKGNAYVFKELADRAYGKVKETIEHTGEVNLTLNDVRQRISELLERRR